MANRLAGDGVPQIRQIAILETLKANIRHADGAASRMPPERWLPHGARIIVNEDPAQLAKGVDPQLQRAIQALPRGWQPA